MTDYTIASPNGGTWTIQSTNTAKVGRYHDLALLLEGAAGAGSSFTTSRPGIFAGPPVATGTQLPGAFAVAATTGFNFSIQPGAAVVERSSLVGSYIVVSTAVGTASVGTPDPSQIRIDRVDLQVLDGALGDNGGVSKTSIKVTAGTPGGGIPAAPANSIPLGSWSIPAGASSLAIATWRAGRKSTGLRGGVRVLLEGDALSDPGFVAGELRDTTMVGGASPGIDRWNPTDGVWNNVIDLGASSVNQFFELPGTIPGVTSTTYTPLQNNAVPPVSCGVAFTAPPSGKVRIAWSAVGRSSADNVSVFIGSAVRQGGTIGSGTIVSDVADGEAAQTDAVGNNVSVEKFRYVTGLTPGSTYNARLSWRVSATGNTGSAASPIIEVTPAK